MTRGLEYLAKETRWGPHWVGWYLRWLIKNRGEYSVLLKRGVLMDGGVVASFDHHLSCIRPSIYSWLGTVDATTMYPKDTYSIVQFDVCLRNGLVDKARQIGRDKAMSLMAQFVGLPHIRLHLYSQTEEVLWTHVKLHCV